MLRQLAIWTLFGWLAGAILAPATSFASFSSAGTCQGSLPEIPLVAALAPGGSSYFGKLQDYVPAEIPLPGVGNASAQNFSAPETITNQYSAIGSTGQIGEDALQTLGGESQFRSKQA